VLHVLMVRVKFSGGRGGGAAAAAEGGMQISSGNLEIISRRSEMRVQTQLRAANDRVSRHETRWETDR